MHGTLVHGECAQHASGVACIDGNTLANRDNQPAVRADSKHWQLALQTQC